MSNKTALLNPETLEQMRTAQEERKVIMHSILMQRILKLRDKIGNNMSLIQISIKLDKLEININGGCDLEELEEEIVTIEKIVSCHFQNPLYAIRHQGQKIIAKAKIILKRKDINDRFENKS